MSKYSGKKITVNRSAQEIADRFGDLTQLQNIIDQLPEAEREKIGQVKFEAQSIKMVSPQVGEISFNVVERTPSKIRFSAEGTPVPLDMDVDLASVSDDSTELSASLDVQIPMMLRAMVGPHLQKAVDMLTGVMAQVASK